MNSLRSIVRTNRAAQLAYLADHGQPHLLTAPFTDEFNHNIPWVYLDGVATLWLHRETKVSDVTDVKEHIDSVHGPDLTYEVKRYS